MSTVNFPPPVATLLIGAETPDNSDGVNGQHPRPKDAHIRRVSRHGAELRDSLTVGKPRDPASHAGRARAAISDNWIVRRRDVPDRAAAN